MTDKDTARDVPTDLPGDHDRATCSGNSHVWTTAARYPRLGERCDCGAVFYWPFKPPELSPDAQEAE